MRGFFFFFTLIFLILAIDYSFSHPQLTSAAVIPQLAYEDAVGSEAASMLSPTPVWPFTPPIVLTAGAEATSSAESLQEQEQGEYCLDVPVLLYHHIQPLSEAQKLGHAQLTVDSDIFEKQMSYLVSEGYSAISAEDLAIALMNHQELPPKPVVITIDDGYIDNYSYAFLMAKKYNLIMNFMISTELIGKPDYMTWDHLKEMVQNPFARIYNHTASHAALGLISSEQINSELRRSNEQFKSQLGLDMNIFTYPYGSFSPLSIEILHKHGFVEAFTTMPGRKQCESDIMLLHRDHVGNAALTEYGL